MSWEHLRRVVITSAAAVLGAVVLVLVPGLPRAHARGAEGALWWTVTLHSGAWGVAADGRGAVVVADDGSVTAVDHSGRERWTAHDVDVTEANPAVGRDVVLVGGEDGLSALGRADGSVRWHDDLPGPIVSVGLTGSVALAGGDAGVLTAFDARTGVVQWSVTRPGELWSAPRVDAASGAVVATWHGGDQPHVEVLDLATGASRWSAPTAPAAAAPVVAGHGPGALVVVAAGDGHYTAAVEARSLATGEVRWQVPVPASFERAVEPAAGRHEVVVVDHFGTVTALDLADGRTRWQRALDEPVLATRVALTPSRVLLATYGGTVTVLGRADGRVVATTDRRRLAGYPVGGVAVRWGGHASWLTGLRLGTATLALVRVP
jgi:outer membrane protein assembly factor BamB